MLEHRVVNLHSTFSYADSQLKHNAGDVGESSAPRGQKIGEQRIVTRTCISDAYSSCSLIWLQRTPPSWPLPLRSHRVMALA